MIPSTLLLTFLRPKTNALRWTRKHPKVTHFFLSSFIHGFLVWISPKKVRTWSLPKTSKIANPPQFCYWRVFYCIKHRPLTTKQLFIWSGQYVLGSSWHHIYYSTSFVRRPSPNPTLRSTACATPSFRPATRSEPKFENYWELLLLRAPWLGHPFPRHGAGFVITFEQLRNSSREFVNIVIYPSVLVNTILY